MKCYILVLGVLASTAAQQYTTPVPILKQINKHNEDGSYSYGYEAADGTFKIESKYPNGEVYGKYGYKDDTGKLREIEYGATKRGFEPQGNDISVPPPTLNNDKVKPLAPNEEDDGQYREDPAIYYKDEGYNRNSVQQSKYHKGVGFQQTLQQPRYHQPAYQQPAYQQPQLQSQPQASKFNFDEFINAPFEFNQPKFQPQPRPQSQPQYQPQYQTQYQPQYQPQYQQQYQSTQQPTSYYNPQPSYYNPSAYNTQPLQGIPAANVNLDLGSYSINYR